MGKDIPSMLRTFYKGEMYRCCMVRARTYPDNGNLESVNYPEKNEELQPDELGKKKKIEDNKKNEEQRSDVSYTYVSNIKRKFRCNVDLQPGVESVHK